MKLEAAGVYRRTQAERDDQRLSWERTDQAFFAAGACHILAWACRDLHSDQGVQIVGLRKARNTAVFHVMATWQGWAFDHCGWHREKATIIVNEAFEGCALERVLIDGTLEQFCHDHNSRLPDQFHASPWGRAVGYVVQFSPPWRVS